MKAGTILRWDKMIGRSTDKKITEYGCEIYGNSVLVEVYYSLYDEKRKPYESQQVWPMDRITKLKPELEAIALAKPKKFLETLIEIENGSK